MATGFSEEGTERLLCGAPPSAATVPVGSGFKSNIFYGAGNHLGQGLDDLTYTVEIPINAGDFSVEWWWLAFWGSAAPNSDVPTEMRFIRPIAGGGGAGQFRHYAVIINATSGQRWRSNYRDVEYGGAANSNMACHPDVYPIGWQHYCVNFDRSGNMEAYVSGIAGATAAISATDLNNLNFCIGASYIGSSTSGYGSTQDTTPEDWNFTHCYGAWGPFAIHNRLLTVAEMQESALNRRVNNLGAAVTLCCYDWTNPTYITGWDSTALNVPLGFRYMPQQRGMSFAAPTGTAGVPVEWDLSGNNRHYPLQVLTAYSSGNWFSTPCRSYLAYGVDPFFFHGGGGYDAGA